MTTPTLSTKYILEICDDTSEGKEVVTFASSTPFLSFSQGDFIDPGMWADVADLPSDVVYEIRHVIHRIHEIPNSHITHKIEIRVIPGMKPI